MSTPAITMMLVSMAVVWGGLLVSIIHLRRHPEGSVQLRDDFGRPVDHPMLDATHPDIPEDTR